jgi:hypothetical protein
MGNTRFLSSYRCMRSVHRCLPALQRGVHEKVLDLRTASVGKSKNAQTGEVTISKLNLNSYLNPSSPESKEFVNHLDFAMAVMEPLVTGLPRGALLLLDLLIHGLSLSPSGTVRG